MRANLTIQDAGMDKKRRHIIDEIYSTEESYVKSLQVCVSSFQTPLLTESPTVVSEKDVLTMFLHFQEIIAVNSMLLQNLQDMKKRGMMYTNTGGAFIQIVPFLKSYTQYASNQDNCIQILKRLDTDQSAQKHLETLRLKINAEQQLDLRSYLIMPVQRLPRYVLLFNDLLKNTPESFPDYLCLKKVTEEIQKVTVLVNQYILQDEKLRRLVEISNTVDFPGGDLTVGRKLIRDGVLNKQCRKAPKPRYFVLCTDILFYTQPRKREVAAVVALVSAEVKGERECQIDVYSPERSFTIITKDEVEKKEWIDDISSAILSCKESSVLLKSPRHRSDNNGLMSQELRPVFVPDDQVSRCQLCSKEFRVTTRKHHCRKCGKCICSDCSKNKMKIQSSMERVCDECYKANYEKQRELLTEAMKDSDSFYGLDTPRGDGNLTRHNDSVLQQPRSPRRGEQETPRTTGDRTRPVKEQELLRHKNNDKARIDKSPGEKQEMNGGRRIGKVQSLTAIWESKSVQQ